ncbi:hypothetical protein GCM10010353_13160 [Streptomyces chryseus]|uniref:Uncharacterized protein n=1 Tax=Streptomyces chryseus TaxID=68186 RepID=A0ABQ3DI80_9ACTN|nr:hypothetical protein GCM10010353_13160 [Streptomyces chryseus]GHA93422.1 hypothetical protein GCM10010346_15110 [Streptomyces chryseus]
MPADEPVALQRVQRPGQHLLAHAVDPPGFFSGAGARTNNDEGPDAVHKADIATAEHLGRRIAETTTVFAAGRAAVAV